MQFDEGGKEMIQVVKCHFEVIFASWPTENSTFFKLIKPWFKCKWHLSHFLPLGKPKFRLWCQESDVLSGRQSLGTHFLPLTSPKCDLGNVEKAMFQMFSCHFEFIFGLLANPKCYWVRSKKRCFKVSHGTLNLFWAPRIAQNAMSRPAIVCLKVLCHASLLEHSTEGWSTCHPTSFNGHCSGDWSVCICERHGGGWNRSRFPVV